MIHMIHTHTQRCRRRTSHQVTEFQCCRKWVCFGEPLALRIFPGETTALQLYYFVLWAVGALRLLDFASTHPSTHTHIHIHTHTHTHTTCTHHILSHTPHKMIPCVCRYRIFCGGQVQHYVADWDPEMYPSSPGAWSDTHRATSSRKFTAAACGEKSSSPDKFRP